MSQKDLFLVAKIVKPKGVRGYFVVKSFLENNNLFKLAITDKYLTKFPLFLLHSLGKNHFLCSSCSIKSRDQSEQLRNIELFCKRSELKKLDKDVFFIEDLLNRAVCNDIDLQKIGIISNVFQDNISGDFLEIRFFDKAMGTKCYLFNKDNFPTIDQNILTINNVIL